VQDKLSVLQQFLTAQNISAAQALYIGDDLTDYYAMKH
jgi:3-deoxy-D-manno-octulosonate 8-phosphate phosphatase KdsC-like HAD superfamily phosphatase